MTSRNVEETDTNAPRGEWGEGGATDPGFARCQAEEVEAGAVEGPELRRRHLAEEGHPHDGVCSGATPRQSESVVKASR